jgi:hypothetical protein
MTEPPDFDRLFRSVTRSAVHLEMRDDYGASSRAFAAWRERRPYDRSGPDAAWHALVGSVTGRGATVRRARIVSEPASDYIRFEHEVTPAANLAAGEQVRWLPRDGARRKSPGVLGEIPHLVAREITGLAGGCRGLFRRVAAGW